LEEFNKDIKKINMVLIRAVIEYCKSANDDDEYPQKFVELDYLSDGMKLDYTEENLFHVCIKHGHVEALELLL